MEGERDRDHFKKDYRNGSTTYNTKQHGISISLTTCCSCLLTSTLLLKCRVKKAVSVFSDRCQRWIRNDCKIFLDFIGVRIALNWGGEKKGGRKGGREGGREGGT